MGSQAALGAAQVPSVTVAEAAEGGEAELQLDDDPSAAVRLDTRGCSLLVSVARVRPPPLPKRPPQLDRHPGT